MKFFSRLFGKKLKSPAPKKVSSPRQAPHEQQLRDDFKTFILEPILTPSALIDGGEDMPDAALLDGQDLPWLDALDAIDQAADEIPELFTSGTFEVGESGEVEFEFLCLG
ncbi:MAG: hypothetical protein AAGA60_05770 [Cyanobacteria bacterium P01_E01_bin.42]